MVPGGSLIIQQAQRSRLIWADMILGEISLLGEISYWEKFHYLEKFHHWEKFINLAKFHYLGEFLTASVSWARQNAITIAEPQRACAVSVGVSYATLYDTSAAQGPPHPSPPASTESGASFRSTRTR